jgi:heat shock protein 1/8
MAVAVVNAQILGVCLGAKKGFTGDLVGESAKKKGVTAFGNNSFFGAGLRNGSGFSGCRLRLKSTSSQRYVRRRGRREEQDGNGSLLRVVAEKVVGIDLGTTNSAVAAMEGGKPTIVTNAEGQRTTPSVVAYSKNGDRLVGQIAKRQSVVNPENTFFSVKRFIGRKMSEIDNESKQVSYHVIRDSNGNVKLDCPAIGKSFAAEEISAQVLRKLVEDASKFLNDKVNKAVITVPAYFNDSQRTATKDAGRIAGVEVLRIINEPTAASLAYGFEKKSNETILVFDLGGGTFDVSVLEVGDGVFEVLSTSGDTHLGGDDFDKRIVDWLANDFKKQEGVDLLKDKQALQRLTETAEKAKMELSSLTQTSISLPFITATADGPKHIDTSLTRAKFEELCSDLLDRCRTPVENSLRDAKLTFKDINEVILVGGSTRIPAVQELVKRLTGKDPNVTVNPDEVVALGAAVQAGVLAGEVSDIVLLDVTPLSLGLETLGGVMTKIIPRNTTLPTSKSEVFSTAADGQTSVEINVLQGEREFVRDNRSVGSFRLDGIPPAPRGVPQIEVRFDIDANGILSVSAQDKGTGKKQDITITGASTLPKDEVERMVKEAEKFGQEDKEKREAVDIKNQADSTIYQTEKQLKELGEKIPAAVKEKVEAKLKEVKDAVAGGSTQTIKDALAALNEEVMQIGQSLYSQGGAGGPAPGETGPTEGSNGAAPGGDDVIDADFTDSK